MEFRRKRIASTGCWSVELYSKDKVASIVPVDLASYRNYVSMIYNLSRGNAKVVVFLMLSSRQGDVCEALLSLKENIDTKVYL